MAFSQYIKPWPWDLPIRWSFLVNFNRRAQRIKMENFEINLSSKVEHHELPNSSENKDLQVLVIYIKLSR